jgi:4-aminobutyrate aminotransferase / (S)-3-amino-2-methylpropionate transaminase / 5-aminovalerate transaminase
MTNTNQSWHARREASVPRGVSTMFPIFAERAENSEIWDVEGRRYIDFAAGIAVLNTGHRHPTVMAAADHQSARFTHTAFQVMGYDSYIELAERLNALAPIEGPAKTFLCSTGAESVENAVKIARSFTGRSAVIVFSGAFHGRTLLATAMTGKAVPYKQNFGPFPGDIHRIPFPIPHHGISLEESLHALKLLLKTDVDPDQVAAIVIEPVQGEGGFQAAPVELMVELRRICDAHGILLVADEVQSGFARTGKLFAMEHYPVMPDLITVAKSLAGGFPLAGVIGRAEVMDAPLPGGLGGTYGGNPIACAAALGVLDAIEQDNLLERSVTIGKAMGTRLQAMKSRNDTAPMGDIRNVGAMVAFELVKARGGHEPDPDMAKAFTAAALRHGLIILSCGLFSNTIRLLVPLTASDALVTEGLDMIEKSLIGLGS